MMNAATMIFLGLCAVMTTGHAGAQYPTKPIRLIIPFPSGGLTDVVGRITAQKLSEGLGQPVVADNRAGAGGTIGADLAAKASPDGYTLFLGTTGTLAAAPNLQPNLPYHPEKSFAPIGQLINTPVVVVVNAAVPAKSLAELIHLAKSRPGKLNYASAGIGSSLHVAGEMFKIANGIDLHHIPYKGAGPAMADFVAGRIDVMFDGVTAYLPHIQSGKLRVLAVAGRARIAQLPSAPTTAEAGLPGYELALWNGLLAPAGTPGNIVKRLNEELVKALGTRDMIETLGKHGLEPAGGTPGQFAALILDEGAKWARTVKTAGIKLE
jgi:tripartite-type tricarboxylate transporter receptor subunit TctC